MVGLLASLDGLSVSIDVTAVGDLGAVVEAVEALTSGPDVVQNLRTAIAELPLPPGLGGLSALAGALDALPDILRLDASAALLPVIQPLTGLSATVTVTGGGGIGALVELLRAGVLLATGRQFGGPLGMPEATDVPQQPKMSREEVTAAIAGARAVLAEIGPFDAPGLFTRLQRAAPNFARPLVRFMPVPVVDELMQPLATLERWRERDGAAITAELVATLGTLTAILDLPARRHIDPLASARGRLAAAPARLAALANTLDPEAATAELRELARLVDADNGPFTGLRELPNDLVHARLAAVRALEPPVTLGGAMARMRALLGEIPPVGVDPMADVVAAIDAFELSALTDALGAVRDAVNSAVEAAEVGREAVRDQLTALLQPVDDALASAIGAFNLPAVTGALAEAPARIQALVDDSIAPVVEPLKAAIQQAVAALSSAAANLDPEALIAPVRGAMEQAAVVINSPEVAGVFTRLEQVLLDIQAVIEAVDLAVAADVVVEGLGDIEAKMREIDPDSIPDPLKPPLREARDFLVGIEIDAAVAQPVADVGAQLGAGVGVLLGDLQRGLEELRMRVERFRPSEMMRDLLGDPFAPITAQLRAFSPGGLLGAVQAELDGLAERAGVIEAGPLLAPLRTGHAEATTALASLSPERLLAPVETAVQGAVGKVLEASGLDVALDGVADLTAEINGWVDIAAELATVLDDAAVLFAAPGDGQAAVGAFVNEALARLDPVDMAALATAFAGAAEANRRNGRAVLAGRGVEALRGAAAAVAALDASPERARLRAAATALPAGAARDALLAADAALSAGLASWSRVTDDIDEVAGALFERTLDHDLAEVIEGGSVFALLDRPPTTVPELKEAIRPALEDAVREPLLTLDAAFSRIAPYLSTMAASIAVLVRAAHAKIGAITGEEGVGGVVGGVDTLVDQLREFDLSPVSGPLQTAHGRLATALAALSPDPLEDAIDAANQAVGSLLDLGRLLPAAEVRALDTSYLAAVGTLEALDPVKVIGDSLDPLFEDLMAIVLPLFELPARLRSLSDAAIAALGQEFLRELARVEEAFDAMLRAIPLEGAGGGASAEVDVSISVG